MNNIFLLIILLDLSQWSQNSFFEISKADPVFCPNQCGHCYRGKWRRSHLKQHLNNECGGSKKFLCNICYKHFSQKGSLKQHMILIHRLLD